MKIVIYGILLHLVFLLSVFDIYFKSPIINNIPLQYSHINAPAKRLVLFVADGLRADSLLSTNDKAYLSPYIRSIIESHGVWGVAHSRVPTESRPGHIALIAGFYEDPSAVFTGWKDNLVEFDSVFNRSHVTYSWGSPDILPMFKKGASENKIYTYCYNPEDEDFSGHGSTKLNTWVFDKVEEFLQTAKHNDTLNASLNSQGVVFFLHLLGPDVAGHASKPHSREYEDNINVVDEGVRRIEKIINDFYSNDNKTAFVYTSDHGMTDWGSHGAGSESETEVPLVVWGAGISTPQLLDTPDMDTPARWNLRHLRRVDVAQADICPLMAVLIGASIPVHSVGVLPLDYLSIPNKDKAAAMALNAEQLAAQFDCKRQEVESNMIKWLYKPFAGLTKSKEEFIKQSITRFANEEKYSDAIKESKILIQLSHDGLEYYHSYYQGLLLSYVSSSFLGWIAWMFCQLSHQEPENNNVNERKTNNILILPDLVFLFLTITTCYLIYVQSLPFQFYLYCCLPLLLWWNVFCQKKAIRNIMKYRTLHLVGSAVLYLILLEFLVMTFFKRWVLSLLVTFIGFWPFTLGERRNLVPASTQMCWLVSSLLLAVFPALPVIGHQTQIEFVILCGGMWLLLGLVTLYYLGHSNIGRVLPVQMVMIVLATATVLSTSWSFKNGLGLQLLNQIIAWLLLVTNLCIPLLSDNELPVRFLSIGMGLAVPFLLLCVGHEAFFLLILFCSLCTWISIEASLSQVKITQLQFNDTSEESLSSTLSPDEFRKSFFFLTYVILSFFGTGNIASINSFDIAWVRCFLTVFSPFTMMALILLKILVPFLLVTCCFRALNIICKVKAENMFVVVLIYCDIMGLHFLFYVTNKGSWMEVGTSVSHFVIMEVTVLFLAILYYISGFYTSGVFTEEQYIIPPTTISPHDISDSRGQPTIPLVLRSTKTEGEIA